MNSVDVGFLLEDDEMKTARMEVHTEDTDGLIFITFHVEDDNVLSISIDEDDVLEVIRGLLAAI